MARLDVFENDASTLQDVFEAAMSRNSKNVLCGLIDMATVAGKVEWALQMHSSLKAKDPSLCKEVQAHCQSRGQISELLKAQKIAREALEGATAAQDIAHLREALVLANDAGLKTEAVKATKLLFALEIAAALAAPPPIEVAAENDEQHHEAEMTKSGSENPEESVTANLCKSSSGQLKRQKQRTKQMPKGGSSARKTVKRQP